MLLEVEFSVWEACSYICSSYINFSSLININNKDNIMESVLFRMVVLLDIDELIEVVGRHHVHALRLIETNDIYDAAEKAWMAIETMRKALLVAIGVSYEKAKSIA